MKISRLFARSLFAVALAPLAACFGTGVLPSTKTSLLCEDTVALSPTQPTYLDVINAGSGDVVAQNVRLDLQPGMARSLGLVSVEATDNCAALPVGAMCTFTLQATSRSDMTAFPQWATVVADNAAPRQVQLTLNAPAAPNGQQQVRVTASNVLLTPPAPTAGHIVVTNASLTHVTLQAPSVDSNANLVIDTSTCAGFPLLPARASCSFLVRAPNQSVPGTYQVTIPFSSVFGDDVAQSRATVAAGELIVNNGAPVLLDSNTTILPVLVQNNGFDLIDLSVNLPWSDTCGGAISLTVDAGACQPLLPANQSCLLRLSTSGATPGTASTISVADVTGRVQSATQPVQINSLLASQLSFAAPGVQQLHLVNLGSKPLSVVSVRVGGDQAGGFSLPSSADLADCQNFSTACNVPITASAGAFTSGGSSSVTVTYSGTGVLEEATGEVVVPAVPIAIHGGNLLTLTAQPGTTQVTLQNNGVFAWMGTGLQLSPALPGISIDANCPANLAAGASCNANLVVAAGGQTGVTVTLRATGANADATSQIPLQVSQALLVVGQDLSGNGVLQPSYDGGNTWAPPSTLPANLLPLKATLAADLWLAVGSQDGNQQVVTSADRGTTWQLASLSPVAGTLADVAQSAAGFVAVGTQAGSGNAVVRFSFDGVTWDDPVDNLLPATLNAVACRASHCVATGSGPTLANQVAYASLDGGRTWGPDASAWAPPAFAGTLYGAASAPNDLFVLAGATTAGAPAFIASATGPSGPYDLADGVLSGTGTLRAAAFNGTQWLAVGDGGGNQLSITTTVAGITAYGSGSLMSVLWTGSHWLAAGNNGSTGLLRSSLDAVTWVDMPFAATAWLTDVAIAP